MCNWKEDESDGHYDTECGNAFEFMNEGITENQFIYCPYCGEEILEINK